MDSDFKVELVVSGLSKGEMQDLFEAWVVEFSKRFDTRTKYIVGFWSDTSTRQLKGTARTSGKSKKAVFNPPRRRKAGVT